MNEPALTPIKEASTDTPTHSPAVQRFCAVRERSLQESRAGKLSSFDAKDRADRACCEAMPEFSGYENIRDFIACVTHGMINGAVHPIQAPKFFFALSQGAVIWVYIGEVFPNHVRSKGQTLEQLQRRLVRN